MHTSENSVLYSLIVEKNPKKQKPTKQNPPTLS